MHCCSVTTCQDGNYSSVPNRFQSKALQLVAFLQVLQIQSQMIYLCLKIGRYIRMLVPILCLACFEQGAKSMTRLHYNKFNL